MNYFGIKLAKNKSKNVRTDGWTKIIILIFFAAFFDFIEFITLNSFLFRTNNFSQSMNGRYSSIQLITSSLLCIFALNFKIGRHQIFSLIGTGIILVIQIIIEIIFNIEFDNFFLVFLLNIYDLFLLSFIDVIERYLGDINFPNPYGITMGEGIFVFIMNSFYSINKNVFGQVNKLYEEFNTEKFVLFIFLLVLFIFLSAVINIYKIHCNIFLSPIERVFGDYLANPILVIYYFLYEDDFKNKKGVQNITIFVINIIILLFYFFLALVYNEYIILSFCNLAHDTNYGIHKRAKTSFISLFDNEKEEEDDDINYNGYKIDFKNNCRNLSVIN